MMKFNLIFGCVIVLVILGNCQQQKKSHTNSTSETNYPDQEGWNSTLIATTNGQMSAIINYGHMKRYSKSSTVFFDEGIMVDFFDDKGKHTSKLSSKKGNLDEKNNNVTAYENVVIVSDSGITLQTEKVWWDNTMEKVISDQFVTITTVENDTLYGVGFESDQTLKNWVIKEVRGKTDKKVDFSFKKKKSVTADSLNNYKTGD